LLGKSSAIGIVFERLDPRYFALGRFCSIAKYKQWILHIIAALKVLHSLGIVYPDLHLENLLFSTDGQALGQLMEWPVTPPLFDRIVEECMRTEPTERPELNELTAMVESIST
ncbi:hypothetical protein N7467_010465, partial [Penicillium canescens]